MASKKTNNLNNFDKPSFVSAPPTSKKKEAMSLCISAKLLSCLHWCYALLFAALAAYYLIGENSDMLYMAQSRNLFQENYAYFLDCMKQPGGFLFWAGTYFTQYFYTPTSGATILITLWLITFCVMQYAFNIKNGWTVLTLVPLVALLCSEICIGYWLYYLKHAGYWFTTSIGFFIAITATLIARLLPEKIKLAWLVVWGIGGYALFGWISFVGILYMCADYAFSYNDKKLNKLIIPIVGIVVIAVTPLICYQFYPSMKLSTMWYAALPIFWASQAFTFKLELPFIIMALFPLVFVFFSKNRSKEEDVKGKEAYSLIATIIVVLGLSAYVTDKVNFDNYNYHAEMRMYRAAEEGRWNDVLTEMGNIPGDATREMVLFKNIALLNTGHLGDGLFKYNNMGEHPYVFDSLQVHMVQTAAPIIYYFHGKTNFSYRWCIENSVEFGYKVQDLQNLTRCAIINEEWDVAKKYLDILKQTTFHKEWAEKYMPLVKNPKLLSQYEEFTNVKELQSHMGTVLDGDNGLPEMYLINYFSNTMNKDSKLLQEVTLTYALIQKDIQLFWPRFFLYAQMHQGEEMPLYYQQAAFLYGNLEPQNVDIRRMPFDKEKVINAYESFHNLSQKLIEQQKALNGSVDQKKIAEEMKPMYGDTFYWFYFFCRDIQSN